MIKPLFGRLSTGLKMLLILSAALLPLGVIAVATSVEFARTSHAARESDVRLVATDAVRRLDSVITDIAAALKKSFASAPTPDGCRLILSDVVAAAHNPIALGLFDRRGRRLCATSGFSAYPMAAPVAGVGTEVRILAPAGMLRFILGDLPGGMVAIGELRRPTLVALIAPARDNIGYGERLREGDAIISLATFEPRRSPLGRATRVSVPVSNGQLSLELESPPTPVRAIEALMILLPILMWLAAAIIGWLVMDRLVLVPLGHLQRAIMAYRPGSGASLQMPTLTTPSIEIRQLAGAFVAVTRTIAEHEADLESGLARQRKLTREVHHRVKNNLQVVSSLINLHSRGVTDPGIEAAYASIQRRVDALAVVHRNHFAELEENRGVGLRPLIGELASNLRATAGPGATNMAITLELAPLFVSQDVAVPVAFLITELVELAMRCDPAGGATVRLAQAEETGRATLSIVAPGLTRSACQPDRAFDRSSRVVEGLSRQLRAPMVRDAERGGYAIEISVTPPLE